MLHAVKQFIERRMAPKPVGLVKGFNVLNEYVRSAPSTQAAVDIFKDEWSTSFPPESGVDNRGVVPAFSDSRISWAIEKLGGVEGKRILELGPLEGGHSCMLEKAGAGSILSIEANKRAFLKCLIVKEMMGMVRTRFILGDFNEYLKATSEEFDVCLASGVLYHMLNPAETIELVSRHARAVYIWTHYYDAQVVAAKKGIQRTMGRVRRANHNGFDHDLCEHFYREFIGLPSFCGGSNPTSCWLKRDDLLKCLKYFGYSEIVVERDDVEHPNGPAISLLAFRPDPS